MARPKSNGTKDSTANLGFQAKLRLTAEKLRNNMDVAEYSRAERDNRGDISICALHEKPSARLLAA